MPEEDQFKFPSSATVRDLLRMPVSADVVGGSGTWAIPYAGPVELTPDAVARWSRLGVLDRKVKMVNGDLAIQGVMDRDDEVNVCSLFATIGGHANDANFRKYIKNIPESEEEESPAGEPEEQ